MNNLAELLESKGDYDGAEPLYCRAIEGICKISRKMGSAHPQLKTMVKNYVSCLEMMGHSAEDIQGALEKLGRRFGIDLADAGWQTEPSPKLRAVIEEIKRDPSKVLDIGEKLLREDPTLLNELSEWFKSQQQE